VTQVADVGVHYVLCGHSERRNLFGEGDELVGRKVQAVVAHGITPILCVGETLDERRAGGAWEVVERQLERGVAGLNDNPRRLVIAYEPVWAIGTGRAATAQGANAVLADVIRPALAALFGQQVAQAARVLYGGSVKAGNAAEFFSQHDIDGALVGGASLKTAEFLPIVQAAAK